MSSKPEYRVPLLSEIEAIKPNGLDLVSTFSGCGGSCLGFRMAGYTTLWANEFIEAARDTYRANHPGVEVCGDDIRKVTPDAILKAVKKMPGQIDVLEGSPPCASFSMAGKRNKKWGDVNAYSDSEQQTDDLFFEFVRLLEGLQPKVFVAENVTGLIRGKAKGYFKQIYRAMRDAGYRLDAKVLDASWLGVPQARYRVIFMGVRNDLERDPVFPKPYEYRYSIAEVLPADPGDTTDADMIRHRTGEEWKKLRPGQTSKKYFQLVRSNPDLPAQTITALAGYPGAASVTHPYECRKFTVPELKRLCSFPDDFEFTGNYKQQVERLGRSVPPLMMRAVAETIRDKVLLPALKGFQVGVIND